jgi:hypothetical protein
MKIFHPTERISVQFQATAVNAFNRPNFNLPNGDISAPATIYKAPGHRAKSISS